MADDKCEKCGHEEKSLAGETRSEQAQRLGAEGRRNVQAAENAERHKAWLESQEEKKE
jgi:hypothetical protein